MIGLKVKKMINEKKKRNEKLKLNELLQNESKN
jgi:hypothetical protein